MVIKILKNPIFVFFIYLLFIFCAKYVLAQIVKCVESYERQRFKDTNQFVVRRGVGSLYVAYVALVSMIFSAICVWIWDKDVSGAVTVLILSFVFSIICFLLIFVRRTEVSENELRKITTFGRTRIYKLNSVTHVIHLSNSTNAFDVYLGNKKVIRFVKSDTNAERLLNLFAAKGIAIKNGRQKINK